MCPHTSRAGGRRRWVRAALRERLSSFRARAALSSPTFNRRESPLLRLKRIHALSVHFFFHVRPVARALKQACSYMY